MDAFERCLSLELFDTKVARGMAAYQYIVDSEPLRDSDASLLEGELVVLADARSVQVNPDRAEFKSALPPEEIKALLLELTWRYGRLAIRYSSRLDGV